MRCERIRQVRQRFVLASYSINSQHAPVRVKRYGRVVGVMVSAEDYEAMRAFYANRLLQTMNETAESAGLTPEKLNELLADDS